MFEFLSHNVTWLDLIIFTVAYNITKDLFGSK